MKTSTYLKASALVLATVLAGPAAANISTGSLATDVQSAIGSGHAGVTVKDGVATLFGVVESRVDANSAESAAANFDGVDKVINRIYISN